MSKTTTPTLKTEKPAIRKAVKEGHFINSEGEEISYTQSSQATYYFDCTGNGKSKGSFCCILKKGTEYFILTAGHNLGNFTKNDIDNKTTRSEVIKKYLENKSTYADQLKYKLIKNEKNFVELELIEIETNGNKDAAILKIVGGNSQADLIKNRKYFTSYEDPTIDERTEEFIGYATKHHDVKIKNPDDATPNHFTVINGDQTPIKGDSGGVILSKENPNILFGMYRALGHEGGVKYSKIEICKKYILC